MTPFPSALRACLTYLGDPWEYDYLMGATGAAFRLTWTPGWSPDGAALRHVARDPFAAFGWGFEAVGRGFDVVDDPAAWRAAIVASIGRRVPVLALGVVGPPEPCVVTGYDGGGEVLLGWSFFQESPEWTRGVEREPGGYFRARDWVRRTAGVVVLGPKGRPPTPKVACRAALERALAITCSAEIHPGRANGLAAYEAWGDAIGQDDEFAAADDAEIARRFHCHSDAVDVVAEGRWYASRFLARAAGHLPFSATELFEAAGHYAAEHELMWEIWDQVGGNDRAEARRHAFAGHAVRCRIAAIVRQARQHEAAAIDAVERALARPQRF